MRFSVITPCYLGPYKQAGIERESKLIRCVNSFLNQSIGKPVEQIVIADGCKLTSEIINREFAYELKHGQVRLIEIPKQKMFSGKVRNAGIEAAKGDYICYLDSDDIIGVEHLSIIDDNLNGNDWIFFNDLIYIRGLFEERFCSIKHYNCGTSNIAHKREMKTRWKDNAGYGRDDWDFILDLKAESAKWMKVSTPEYIVCHIPKSYDI